MLQTDTKSVLSIEDLIVEFPSRHRVLKAVNGANVDLRAGEIHGLVGESGAGKSTIGAAIMGLIERPGRIAGGTIRLNEEVISGLDVEAMKALRGKKISMIFQDPLTSLNPLFKVGEQLEETIEAHLDVSGSEARERAIDYLRQVGIPDPERRIDHYPHQFSGGMRQRVVIALALCSEPDVIIADEPTTALDVSVQAQILALIKELTVSRGVGVILITHDMGVIAETTDRVTVMYQGQVVESGPTADVLGKPQHEYTKSLVAAVPRASKKLHRFPKVNYGQNQSDFQIEDLARNWPAREVNREKKLFEVANLQKTFVARKSLLPWNTKYFNAVEDVSFDIREGEVFGLVGESGSGKSTIARVIAGLYRADGGSITYDGEMITGKSSADLADYRRQIQMVFQDPYSSLNPRMRVEDIIAEPAKHHGLLSGSALKDRVGELLERVGLGAQAGMRFPHEFSGGQRQRISIARALATQPRFLICDEPTSALDVSIQAQILNILKDLQEHLGLTMLFISHDLPVVRQMCDRVGVLKNGKLVELAETEELFKAPKDTYTQQLIAEMPKVDLLSKDGWEDVA